MMDFQLNKILIFLGQNSQNLSSQSLHGIHRSYIQYVVYFK